MVASLITKMDSVRWGIIFAISDLRCFPGRTTLDVLVVAISLWLVLLVSAIGEGVVQGFATDILNTPEMLHIGVKPSSLTDEHIDQLAKEPEVSFVAADISFLNRMIPVVHSDNISQQIVTARVTPTGPGDPYFPTDVHELDLMDVWIGDDLADATDKLAGDSLTLSYYVRVGEPPEIIRLNIRGVVQTSQYLERAALVHSRLAAAISVRAHSVTGEVVFDGSKTDFGLNRHSEYISIRLYASSLEKVSDLVRKVNALGWDAEANEELIDQRLALEAATDIIVDIIASAVWFMFIASFSLTTSTRVLRLRPALGNLMGHGASYFDAGLIPLVQTIFIATIGICMTIVTFLFTSQIITRELSESLNTLGVADASVTLNIWFTTIVSALMIAIAFIVTWLSIYLAGIKSTYRGNEDV